MSPWWFLLIPMTPLIIILLFLLACLLFYGTGYTTKVIQTTKRDLRGLGILIRMRVRCATAFHRNRGIQDLFLDTVRRVPDKIAIHDMSIGRSVTFLELNQLSCRYAHMLQNSGIRRGDVVGLLMENGINYVAAWMGCAKIGAVSAWINTNLRRQPLAHTISTSSAKQIICSQAFYENLTEVFAEGLLSSDGLRVFVVGGPSDDNRVVSVDNVINSFPGTEPEVQNPSTFSDPLCYIYTSGTTGLPKAAVIKHFRFFYIATGGECAFGIRPKTDRIYICLPMYHTSAGVLGIGQSIIHGATCVVRGRFSASNFWKDCVAHECTVAIYIGELLRYILLTQKCPEETSHKVRLLIGNGLRPAIWHNFQARFHIERIAEFYGSTEGTSNLVNIDGKEGSCGFMTILGIFSSLYPVRLFRVGKNGELAKDSRGYLVPIKPGESGALACTIKKNNPLYHFEGYLDKDETEKKVIREPLPGADPVFISGDILRWDRRGYFYFVDRMGDTFRWKGENVSTTEVEAVLCSMDKIAECTVYGVKIPGCEGRAGMAAVVPAPGCLLANLIPQIHFHMTSSLPQYAVPLFLRVLNTIDKTGTFKMKKTDLQQRGFILDNDSSVFYLDNTTKSYIPLNESILNMIEREELKV